jgi:hypothetical protein
MNRDYPPAIVDIRVVKRVNHETDIDGINIITVISERIEFRRYGETTWTQPDVIIERADDQA